MTKWAFQSETSGLDKVEARLEKIQNRLEFLGAVEVLKGVYELAERFSHFAEELNVAAESAGITVEAFQGLAFAASQSAIGQDEMGTAMARLSRHLYDARMGSEEAQKAFMLAGFTPQQIMGLRTGSDALLALADKFKDIKDPIQKQAMGMELLGRNSIKMVGFLSKGSAAIRGMSDEAGRLGIVLSTGQVDALVKLEHALLKVWGIVKAFGATIAAYFSPSLETAINEVISFYEANKKLIDLELRKWIYDITFAMGFVWAAVKYVTQAFLDWAASHEPLVRHAGELAIALGALSLAAIGIQKAFGVAEAAFTALTIVAGPLSTLLGVLAAEEMALVGPWLLMAAAISTVVVAMKDLMDTSLGMNFSQTHIGSSMASTSGIMGWLMGKLGGNDIAQYLSGMNGVAGMMGPPRPESMPGSAASTSTTIGGATVTVGPFHIDGSHSDPKQIATEIGTIVQDMFDRQHREAARSLKAVVAH